jgi:hypothetical protein
MIVVRKLLDQSRRTKLVVGIPVWSRLPRGRPPQRATRKPPLAKRSVAFLAIPPDAIDTGFEAATRAQVVRGATIGVQLDKLGIATDGTACL